MAKSAAAKRAETKAKKDLNKTKKKVNKDFKATKSDLEVIHNRTRNRIAKVTKQDKAAFDKTGKDLSTLDAILKANLNEGNEMSRQHILDQQNRLGIVGSGLGTFDQDAMMAANIAAIQAKNNQSNNSSIGRSAQGIFNMNRDANKRNYTTQSKNARLARKDALEQARERYQEQMEHIAEQEKARQEAQRAARRSYGGGGGYRRYGGSYGGGRRVSGGTAGAGGGGISRQQKSLVDSIASRKNAQRKQNSMKANTVVNKIIGLLPGGGKFR